MATDTDQYYGQTDPSTGSGEWNRQRFTIQQQIMNLNTNIPVQVLRVNGVGVNPVGFVDVLVLVSQVTGNDMTLDNLEIPNVPYMRIQGGTNAVIIDPEVGDIGLGSFCSRDISAVKNARQAAPPGSRRAYNFSDCMYTGGFLNKAPTQYIQFTEGGILLHSPNQVTAEAPMVQCSSADVQLGNVSGALRKLIDERLIAIYNAHTHGGGSVPSVPLSLATVATAITKAN